MNNLNKFRKSTVAILTALLIISIAAPLLSFAVAAGAPTASLGVTSGPNGTVITVSGTGYGVSESAGAANIYVSVDGQAAGTNVITTTKGAVAGTNPAVSITAADQLATSATGVLSGKIILYGLPIGAHTITIYDSTTSQVAGTFTITTPSVTVSPSTVAAGSSVIVSGSAFPVSTYYTNDIYQSTFSTNPITVATGATTATATELSSNVITATGTYTGTVSLPAITSGSAFTLKDEFGNVATATLSTGAGTVTLSPSSGPVGTVVTATVTNFGPGATISTAGSNVKVGNVVASLETATVTPTSVTVTEQGTAVFLFTIPAGTTTTKTGVAGAQAVKVTDSKGNVGTATFTVTPQVTLTLGNAASSGTTYAPASTPAKLFIVASGLKASTALTITASPNTPTAWIIPTGTWTMTTGTYSATTGKVSTSANGQVSIVSDLGTSPAAAGQYSVTISDGTNSISTILTITTSGNIIAVTPTSGAKGSTATVTYFGATPTDIYFDGVSVANPGAASHQTWPLVSTNTQAITVPVAATAGLHTVSAGASFNSVGYTVVATSVTVVSPASASVGTKVTVVGSGYSGATAALSMQGASVTAASDDLSGMIFIATFTVPNYLPGSYSLSLSDGTNAASSTLNVASPSIQITPTTSTLGTATIAITGSGFAAGEAITVNFDTSAMTITVPVGLTVFNSNGGILLLSGYDVPTSTTAGTHTVTVLGASGAYAQTTFTVQPSLTAIAAVRPGAKITITGTGFAANSLQTLTVNGTATTWMNVAGVPVAFNPQSTVITGATGDLYTTSAAGFVVSTTQEPGTLVITVTDASGNTASTNLIVLANQAITLGASQIVAGSIATGVTISGSGFTPGSRAMTANLYQGSTLITAVTLTGSPVTVAVDGTFASTLLSFKIPAGIVAGDYTLRLIAGTETADASLTVMSAPTLTAPTTAVSGSNVTVSVTGLSAITGATFSSTNLITSSLIGPTTISSTGTGAFTSTTWFIVPTTLFAGTYLLTLTDGNTGLSVQKAITVQPAITLTPTLGIKGTTVTIAGTGFAASSTVTATFNGAAITLSATTTSGAGAISPTFAVPITATETNTVTVTDAAGNVASATFTLSVPTLTVNPTSAGAGTTVQLLGSGFTAGSAIVVQAGSQIITTVPATITATGGSFIAYFTVPTGLSGNVTVTATDTTNNVGTTYLTVNGGSTSTFQLSTTTLASSAQTQNGAGTATTSFTSGTEVQVSFVLQSTTGSGNVVCKVTFQQGAKVYGLNSSPATISTTPSSPSFSMLLPVGATGTWTAKLQVYAADGVTPLGVTILTFTVA